MKKIECQIDSPSGKPINMDLLMDKDRPENLAVFCHGFKGFKDWGCFNKIQAEFAKEGISFLKFNFSHNGTTSDSPTEFSDLEAFGNNNFTLELEDLDAVMNWVHTQESMSDLKNISLIGHSRGGGLALIYASEKAPNQLITWAAVSDFGKNWDEDFMKKSEQNNGVVIANMRTGQKMPLYHQLFQNYFQNIDRLYIPSRLPHITCPSLIIHGKKDEAVDYHSAIDISEAIADADLCLLGKADHTFGVKHPWEMEYMPADLRTVVERTIGFIKKDPSA